MAYNKYTWVDGELITAEKLNHMEDGIAEGGSGEAGYECTETTEQLFNGTVTTVENDGVCIAPLNYLGLITADELTVIFNGTQYVCPKIDDGDVAYYGGFDLSAGTPDFTNYPFVIASTGGANYIATESPMTVTVSASAASSTVETTECFEKAVSMVVSPMLPNFECTKSVKQTYTDNQVTTEIGDLDLPSAVLPVSLSAYGMKVVLDGVEYLCSRLWTSGTFYYGSVDFSMTDFPFVISCVQNGSQSTLYTKTAGEHSIYVEEYRYEPTKIPPCLASVIEQIVTVLQNK